MEKLAVVLEVQAKPGRRDEVREAWDRHLRPRLEAPDSAQELYLVCNDTSDADRLLLIELYADPGRLQENAEAPWFAAYLREVGPLLAGRPRMTTATPIWAKGTEL